MITKPYTPDEKLSKLLDAYNRRLVVKWSEIVFGGSPNNFIRLGQVICPEGVSVKFVNMFSGDSAAVTVFGNYPIGCVVILQSSRILGVPTAVMRVKAIEHGVTAEWSKDGVPNLPRYLSAGNVRVEGYLSLKKVEEDAEAYLRAVDSLMELSKPRVAV